MIITPNQEIKLKKYSYRVVKEINSEGGQSTIWEAIQIKTEKHVALKCPKISNTTGKGARHNIERAKEEILLLENINEYAHENFISPCLDNGFITRREKDFPIMIMNLYQHDFFDFIASNEYEENLSRTFNFKDLLSWSKQLAIALNYLHGYKLDAKNVYIHRDLKPSNVMLDEENQARLIDFGIARSVTSLGTATTAGTANFLAPEQKLAIYINRKGKKQYLLSPAIDIYSLGLILYCVVTGEMETEAQSELDDSDIVFDHDSHLPKAGIENYDRIGSLGEIGGLSFPEKQNLHRKLSSLISGGGGVKDGKTIILDEESNEDFVVDYYLSLINQLTQKWPESRPRAKDIVASITLLEDFLDSEIKLFKIVTSPEKIQVGKKLSIEIKIVGKGLLADCRWLSIFVNSKPVKYQIITKKYDSTTILSAHKEYFLSVSLPLQTIIGIQNIKLIADAANASSTPHIIETKCEVYRSAKQLWKSNEKISALELELRLDWLKLHVKEIHQKKQSKLDCLIEEKKFYQKLLKIHSNNPNKNTLLEGIKNLDNLESAIKPSLRFKWFSAIKNSVFAILYTATLTWLFYLPPITDTGEKNIYNNTSIHKSSQNYIQWLQNGTKDEQIKAFTTIKKAADLNNDQTAYYWVGYAYAYGKGVGRNSKKAKKWLSLPTPKYPEYQKASHQLLNQIAKGN